jgi:hypothetical protein
MATGEMSPLTKLKELARTDPRLRDLLYDTTETMTCQQWIQCVHEVLNIRLSGRSAVTRFRTHVETLHALEDQEHRRELIIERYREQYPNETEEQLNQRAILFFKQEAFAIGDRDGFIKIGRYSIALKAQAIRERTQAVNERLATLKMQFVELKITLLQAAQQIPATQPSLHQNALPASPVDTEHRGPSLEEPSDIPTPENLPAPRFKIPAPITERTVEPGNSGPLYPLFPLFPISPIQSKYEFPSLDYRPGAARSPVPSGIEIAPRMITMAGHSA